MYSASFHFRTQRNETEASSFLCTNVLDCTRYEDIHNFTDDTIFIIHVTNTEKNVTTSALVEMGSPDTLKELYGKMITFINFLSVLYLSLHFNVIVVVKLFIRLPIIKRFVWSCYLHSCFDHKFSFVLKHLTAFLLNRFPPIFSLRDFLK